jgi:thioredoxin reductase
MNYRVDVIIIGDSKAGHEILDAIATKKPSAKLAFVSQSFKSTTTHDYLNVKYVRGEVIYTSYRHRLFYCYLKNGDLILSTYMIIASGVSYEPLTINNETVPCVFNTVDDIPKTAKNQPALVIGTQAPDVTLALEVSKKYKQVYLCSKDLSIAAQITPATAKKLAKAENLVVLPNVSIQKVISKKNVLQKVELDNYSTINCSAIYAKTKSTPAVEFVSKKLITKNDAGYLIVSENAESTIVPKCFAIGNCIQKYTKTMGRKLVETILNDF